MPADAVDDGDESQETAFLRFLAQLKSDGDESQDVAFMRYVAQLKTGWIPLPPPSPALPFMCEAEHLTLLDHLPIPIALFNGPMIWCNRALLEFFGRDSLDAHLTAFNASLPADPIKRRWMTTHRRVQVELQSDDGQGIFITFYPPNRPPQEFTIRCFPMNADLSEIVSRHRPQAGSARGVYVARIYVPREAGGTDSEKRASRCFNYCASLESMVSASGEVLLQNFAAESWWDAAAKLGAAANRIDALFGADTSKVMELFSTLSSWRAKYEVLPGVWHMATATAGPDPATIYL